MWEELTLALDMPNIDRASIIGGYFAESCCKKHLHSHLVIWVSINVCTSNIRCSLFPQSQPKNMKEKKNNIKQKANLNVHHLGQ
jgi:hypothetical protein